MTCSVTHTAVVLLPPNLFLLCLFIPLLSPSAGDKPSCLKVIAVKIIYENFSIFFLGNFEWKTPTDICSCGCRCSFVLVRLFVLKSARAVGFKYNIVQNISPSLTHTLAYTRASGRVSGSQLDFENPDSSPGRTHSLRFLIVIFRSESEGVNQGSSCVCVLECESVWLWRQKCVCVPVSVSLTTPEVSPITVPCPTGTKFHRL